MKNLRIDAIVFILIISVLGILNFFNFDKPEISVLENRALRSKPEFSMKELLQGVYLKSYEDYYSDTFIFRDSLVKANRDLRHAMEFLGPDVTLITAYDDIQKPEEAYEQAQSDMAGDLDGKGVGNSALSEAGNVPNDGLSDGGGNSTANGNGNSGISTPGGLGGEEIANGGMNGMTGETGSGVADKENSDGSAERTASETGTAEEEIEKDFGDGQDVGYWLVVDGKAVQLFKFNKESFEYYSQILNKYSQKMGSGVKIYSMIPPTASEFVQLKRYKGITDSQNDALGFLKSKLDKSITSVNVYDTLNEHKDEYIYFRTDHHWTALGAYYAYASFMEAKQEQPVPLVQYEKLDLGNYLGSSYTKTLNKSLEKNPDNFIAYKPFTNYEYIMHYGKDEEEADVIDMKYADQISNKYLTFISSGGGTWSVIKTDVHNGKRIMVIKDSFGNALVPFLLPHYEEIYVVDARFYSIKATGKTIVEFAHDKGIDELLFVIYMEDVNWHKFMSGVDSLLGSEEQAETVKTD